MTRRKIDVALKAAPWRFRPDVPILGFTGAWLVVMSWDAGGTEGLIFPGLIGWVLFVVALLRATIRRRAATALETARDPALRRIVLWLWVASALFFAVAVGGELFVGRWMPDSWRDTLVKTFHVRRGLCCQ